MKKNNASLLLVEDDVNLGFVLNDFLNLSGYDTVLAKDGEEGFLKFRDGNFDLCILDVMLPVKDGFTLAEEIRKQNPSIPIIFLTAKTLETDRIKGFKSGGDDYITKPFSTEELSLRIEAILRRSKYNILRNDVPTVFKFGNSSFDYTNHLLKTPTGERRLTKKESEVLRLLCINQDQIVKREIALKNIWGEDDYFMGRSMDVYITKLRKFLLSDAKVSIINIPRTGFKLEVKA
ncbi:MAG: response regulator transcription factor [Bacteroidales bacterium]|nr:response regulator transcription factor [Bacteroidales bacterium]MCF8391991.1 response regulator transcription factor [Bacteroidales bacterium]